MFNNCTYLLDVDMRNVNFGNYTSATYMCNGCAKFTKTPVLIIPDSCTNISYIFADSGITDISGLTFSNGISNATSWIPPKLITANNVTVKCSQALFKGNTTLVSIDNFTISSNVNDISSWFEGCTKLNKDFDIPLHVTNCSKAFKDCVNMTHVHSNWNKTYTNSITPTDCYAGCTEITHIDGENILAYEGDSGIDYIPYAWGGNNFTKSNSGIYEFAIPSDSYEIVFSSLISDETVNWGDGTITKGEKTHIYSKAGTYTVKAKGWLGNHNPTGNPSINANSQATLTKVLRIPYENTGEYHFSIRGGFTHCRKLTYADISNLNVEKCTRYDLLFNGCSSLNTIVFPEGFLRKSTEHYSIFSGCSSLKNIDVSKWGVTNLSNLNGTFSGSNLEYLDLSVWDLKNCTGFRGTFENCSKLKTLIMPTLTPNKVKTSNGNNYMSFQSMLKDCSSLKEFDISHWEEINVGSVHRFMEGSGIETFDLSCVNLKTPHLGYSMPNTHKTLVNATFYKTFLPNDLSNVNPFQNFSLTSFTQLSKESLLSFLNCLADITSSGKSYTIPLGSTNLAKLSSDEIKIATDKGWSVG